MATLVLLPGGVALRRPAAVREVMARLLELDLTGLPRSARSVLLYLGSLICVKDPASPVYPRRATIARETGFSEPTIYRALDALERQGWISRDAQSQDAATGCFGDSMIRFGEAILQAFGRGCSTAHEPEISELRSEPAPACNEASTAPGINEPDAQVEPSPTLISQASLCIPGSFLEKSNPPAGFVEKRHSIPAELGFLQTVGQLKPEQIVTLMSVAKRHAVWLQDLVAAKADIIRRGAVKNLFGYLRSLIQSGTDWKWAARHRHEDAERVERETNSRRAARDALLEQSSAYAGKAFLNAKGRRFVVDENGQRVTTWIDGIRRVGQVDQAFVDAIRSGVLLACEA